MDFPGVRKAQQREKRSVLKALVSHDEVEDCHARAGGHPGISRSFWIPACAGMTCSAVS
jgi:hypothetical protein